MRSLLTACAVFVLTTTLGFSQGTTATDAAPHSKLEIIGGETYDWGKTKPPADGHLEATIKMKNVGNKPLKIVEVKPGCGCTKTDPDKMELTSGDVSTMGVKLNISPAQQGAITKSITIRWMDQDAFDALDAHRTKGTPIPAGTDTNAHVSYLFLKADIQRAISLTPSVYFAFQNLEIGQKSNNTVKITNNSDIPITFSDFTSDNGMVLSQKSKIELKPHESFDLTATIVPSMAGQFSALAQCKTSHPEHPTLDIRAYGFVKESKSPVFQQSKQ